MNGNDQILDKPIPAKWQIMWILGVLLILGSLISLVPAYGRAQVKTAIDYFGGDPDCTFRSEVDMQPNTRIAYCITYKLIKYDMPLFSEGITDQDEVTVEGINIRRQEQTLFINNQLLQFGERYNAVRRNLFNPWLMISTQFDCYWSVASSRDMFYVTCDANEIPQINPLGAIILFGGIGLVILGSWGINRTKIAREQSAMQPPDALKIKARDIALGLFGWVLLDSAYFSLFYRMSGDSVVGTPFILWVPTIIAIPVLYARKRFYICAGTALAVIINVGGWMFITRDFMDPFIVLIAVAGVPLPLGLLLLW